MNLNSWVSLPCFALLDKRVAKLSDTQFTWWVILQMLAKMQGGYISDIDSASMVIRCDPKEMAQAGKELVKKGLLQSIDGYFVPVELEPTIIMKTTSAQRMKRKWERDKALKAIRKASVAEKPRTEIAQKDDIHRQPIAEQGAKIDEQAEKIGLTPNLTHPLTPPEEKANKKTLLDVSVEIMTHLNAVSGRNFLVYNSNGTPSTATLAALNCLQKGASKDDLIAIIDYQNSISVNETERRARLTPSNIFELFEKED